MSRWLMSMLMVQFVWLPIASADEDNAEAESTDVLEAKHTLIDVVDESKELEIGVQTRIFEQARERRDEIETLEKRLKRRHARMSKLIEDVEDRYKTLRMIQEEASRIVDGEQTAKKDSKEDAAKKEERTKQIIKLSRFFSAMKAKEVAQVIPELDEDLVVEVLKRLKDKKAGKILDQLEKPLAGTLMMKMTGTKIKKKKKKKKAPVPTEPAPTAEADEKEVAPKRPE